MLPNSPLLAMLSGGGSTFVPVVFAAIACAAAGSLKTSAASGVGGSSPRFLPSFFKLVSIFPSSSPASVGCGEAVSSTFGRATSGGFKAAVCLFESMPLPISESSI